MVMVLLSRRLLLLWLVLVVLVWWVVVCGRLCCRRVVGRVCGGRLGGWVGLLVGVGWMWWMSVFRWRGVRCLSIVRWCWLMVVRGCWVGWRFWRVGVVVVVWCRVWQVVVGWRFCLLGRVLSVWVWVRGCMGCLGCSGRRWMRCVLGWMCGWGVRCWA